MREIKTVRDMGEKNIIRSILKPLLNPTNEPDLIGDDCAVIKLSKACSICVSTDRVPADLISFRLGLIDFFHLGYYLAVLNLSDIASMGADPVGILLNLGLEPAFPLEDFKQLVLGANKACQDYSCKILGGDLSSASELSISATSIGISSYDRVLRRVGAQPEDKVFCTDYLGLTSTAFYYFLQAKKAGLCLTADEEKILIDQFRKPKAQFHVSSMLRDSGLRITCMDNTDGIGQTLLELSEVNELAFKLEVSRFPIHNISRKIASYLGLDIVDIVLGPGADFQLLGTIPTSTEPVSWGISQGLHFIGSTTSGSGLFLVDTKGVSRHLEVKGWNYFHQESTDSILQL